MIKIGVTGGIGSGKSTVCRLFSERGIPCYEADREAKRLMAEDGTLREAIIARFGAESYTSEGLNRAYLAQKVFADGEALAALNSLVHPAVREDFRQWAEGQQAPYLLLESALLFSADFAREVDYTLAVVAPEQLRLERTMQRDGTTEEAVRARMAAQMSDEELAQRADWVLVNILQEDTASEVEALDKRLRHDQKAL